MVKDKELGTGELFRKTEPKKGPEWPDDNSDLDEGRIMANCVGLRWGEIQALDAIAARFELARNALIRLAVRRMILDFRAGNLDLMKLAEDRPPVRQPRRRLRMPKK
jgi:hypothetical protein